MTTTITDSTDARRAWQNWGRTVRAHPRDVVTPTSVEEVCEIVATAGRSGRRVKAVGAGHSFTAIARADDVQMSLDGLSGLRSVDPARQTVTIGAGTRLHEIPALLAPLGLAMQNLGDIDTQSIAGAVSTGTHGTGARFRGIAAQIVGVTLVTGRGERMRVDAEHSPQLLPAVALGLGALGILVEVTVQCVPAFDLRARERAEPLAAVLDSLDARVRDADHFEFFWFPHTDVALTKTNTRVRAGDGRAPLKPVRRWFDETLMANGVFRATCALGKLVPAAVPTINRAAARLAGERSFSDVSSRVFATRRTVRFTEMEYALPIDQAVPAFLEVQEAITRGGWRITFPVEVRFAAADELWMSTAYQRPSAYIAVHRAVGEDPQPYFRAVEQIMRARGGRPHWGKLHGRTAADLAGEYPRFADFLTVRDDLDPQRVFANEHLERMLGA
ncbi:D-arabinono-1,4-lactone oxidase [Microbacterium sp. NPDC089987]|uniref:D-arabinono-1,4-lactone oxidase n=1 Tax=Microbacterium sp. NPDC089987 TaxID=3364202 RepID=UPI0038018056